MSYDIYLRGDPPACPTCGHRAEVPDLPDPTYNLTPIFHLALTGEPLPNPDVSELAVVALGARTDHLRGLRVLSGLKAGDTITTIEAAIDRLNDPAWHDRFVALEPENKWGDLPGARMVMGWLLQAAKGHPSLVWEIH